MAIQTQGTTGNVMEVDTSFKAARATLRPAESLAWHSIGASTGLITGIAAGAANFSLRNISSNVLIIRRVGIGFVTTTAFTAAQLMEFGLTVARAFTASDTGGTIVNLTGSNAKHRTSLATLTSVDCRVSGAAALVAGTRTLDGTSLATIGGWSAAAGQTIVPAPDNLLQHAAGDYPLVLAQNEGLIIQNLTTMGAAGVGKLYVNLEVAEAVSY